MDDADLGKPISETCQAVDSKSHGQDDANEHDGASQVEDGPTYAYASVVALCCCVLD